MNQDGGLNLVQLLLEQATIAASQNTPSGQSIHLAWHNRNAVFAAAAAPTLWAAVTENYGAMGGIGLDYFTILAPVAILSFQLGQGGSDPEMISYAIACVFAAFFGLGLFLWSIRFPINPVPPLPGLLRWSFVFFIIALLIVGGRLVFQITG
jgi:hypothetical protein